MAYPGAIRSDASQDPIDLALAVRFAPRLLFDRHEPFLPLAAGYTLFHADGYSDSFPRYVGLSSVGGGEIAMAIEYAIWWDWDIQHLYELEHCWTFIDGEGNVIHVEGSWHGKFNTMHVGGRPLLHKVSHPVLYAQPGKHAMAPSAQTFKEMAGETRRECKEAGKGGLLVKPMFESLLGPMKTTETDRLVNNFLATRAFEPAFVWDRIFDITAKILVPWPFLADWIPDRVSWILTRLRKAHPPYDG